MTQSGESDRQLLLSNARALLLAAEKKAGHGSQLPELREALNLVIVALHSVVSSLDRSDNDA